MGYYIKLLDGPLTGQLLPWFKPQPEIIIAQFTPEYVCYRYKFVDMGGADEPDAIYYLFDAVLTPKN